MRKNQEGADEASITKTQRPTDILNELENHKPIVYKNCFGVFYNKAECSSCGDARQCKAALFLRV